LKLSNCTKSTADVYNDATQQYDQSVAIDGTVVSTLSTGKFLHNPWRCKGLIVAASGHAEGWGTAVECQDAACVGKVDAHGKFSSFNPSRPELTEADYIDTTIILDQADPSFGNTLGLNEATSSGLSSPDGGKTWAVGTISHNAFTFNFPS
jgi:hypothetical protein